MSKNDVKDWQRALKTLGVYLGNIDGDFGDGTRRASFEAINLPLPENTVNADSNSVATLVMVNQSATRNKPITENLRNRLIDSVTAVYGGSHTIKVYSGGQDQKGKGKRRTGSIRHDDFGNGGRAADCYILDMDGNKISGVELGKLGQYWLAKKYGGCGLEMATGGIHLDEWTTPPKGGGLFWTYAYSDRKSWGKKVRAMMVAGSKGLLPK